jgi:hypothetical protein
MSMKQTPDSKMTRRFRGPDLKIMQMTRKVHGSKRKGRITSNLYFAKLLCALALTTACVTETATTVSPIEDTCGPAPVFPGLAAAFERMPDGRLMAVVTTTTFGELVAYRNDARVWTECVVGSSYDPLLVRTVSHFDELGPAAEALLKP